MNTGLRVMVFQKYLQNCGGFEYIQETDAVGEVHYTCSIKMIACIEK